MNPVKHYLILVLATALASSAVWRWATLDARTMLAKADRVLLMTYKQRIHADKARADALQFRKECMGPYEAEELIVLATSEPRPDSGDDLPHLRIDTPPARFKTVYVNDGVPVFVSHPDGSVEQVWPRD